MTAYYNEIDPFAAAWLRELIKAGLIPAGDVDERSIEDVKPQELEKYTQCHFFAGIGVWPYALRQAGWPDDRPVWTGSCPCQPFSAAGKKAGFTDERHLWPHWFHLITQRRPRRIFGEQVASKDGLGWLDLVQADLEAAQYANAAVDLCAAGVGAPHIRQRLWFVAERLEYAEHERERSTRQLTAGTGNALGSSEISGLANASSEGFQGGEREGTARTQGKSCGHAGQCEQCSRVADTTSNRCAGGGTSPETKEGLPEGSNVDGELSNRSEGCTLPDPLLANGIWKDADFLYCRDEKWRPVEPGTFPLAHGTASRMGRLRGYGNAINAEAAKEMIAAYMETEEITP